MSNHQLATAIATLTLQVDSLKKAMPVFIKTYQSNSKTQPSPTVFSERQLELFAQIGDEMAMQLERIKGLI